MPEVVSESSGSAVAVTVACRMTATAWSVVSDKVTSVCSVPEPPVAILTLATTVARVVPGVIGVVWVGGVTRVEVQSSVRVEPLRAHDQPVGDGVAANVSPLGSVATIEGSWSAAAAVALVEAARVSV